MEGPRLVVYSDGLRHRRRDEDPRRSTPEELSDLVRALRRELDGFGPTGRRRARRTRSPTRPTTTLRVQGEDGTLTSVSAYALERVDRLRRAAARGQGPAGGAGPPGRWPTARPYTGERVRLVAQRLDSRRRARSSPGRPGCRCRRPSATASDVRKADLTGAEAQAVAAKVPDTWRAGPWPVLRTTDGKLYGVAWRYLVPDE